MTGIRTHINGETGPLEATAEAGGSMAAVISRSPFTSAFGRALPHTADQGRCNKHTYVLAILRHIQNTLNDMRFQQIFPQM